MHDIVVVVASFNRPELIKQTIESIQTNSVMDVKIVVVDNSKNAKTPEYLRSLKDIIYYRFPKLDDAYEYADHINVNTDIGRALKLSKGSVYWDNRMTVGKSYMKGAELAPTSRYILFTQNDMYHLPGWDIVMTDALKKYEDLIMVAGYSGGTGEGGRKVDDRIVQTVGKVPGSNMMFRRKDWKMIGAFPDYDEDNWMCAELRTRYNKTIGLIFPYVLIHCGYTSTLVEGKEHERTKTSDWQTVERSMKEYKELFYE